MTILGVIASDAVLDAADEWLCRRVQAKCHVVVATFFGCWS